MFVLPIDYFLAGWFLLAFASTAYVAVDQYSSNPEPAVMKWGVILVKLYMGPIGRLLCVLADRSRARRERMQRSRSPSRLMQIRSVTVHRMWWGAMRTRSSDVRHSVWVSGDAS